MSDLYVKGRSGNYAIYREGVGRISGFHRSEFAALDSLDRLKKNEGSRDRKCMCCQTVFRSEGIHNRLCNVCRTKDFDPAMLQTTSVVL